MMTNKKNNWLQLLCWVGLYIFWIMVFQRRAFAFSQTLTVQFCYLLFIAANFYFNTLFTIPVFLYRKRYFAFAITMLTGIFITACLRVPLAMYLNAHFFLVNKPQPGGIELLTGSFLNIFIWVVCIVSGKLIVDRFRFQQYLDDMAQEKARAELDFLNAQFNPHFLFNSINSIYGHIDKQNTTARSMLLTFSETLRYQLYECNTETIGIDKEINYLRNYVTMQQARKEDSLVVQFCIDEDINGFTIAPLLFVAFVENAFKYVSNTDDARNEVIISFQKTEDILLFTCFNTKETIDTNTIEHKGIGITNAKRRLALLYPGKHDLKIEDSTAAYKVTLKLHLHEN
ncbi:MAG: histidine kinase [Flavipsychrobacter sp.]|nr:histidine kinase [Flavipsychrobacter sp.]